MFPGFLPSFLAPQKRLFIEMLNGADMISKRAKGVNMVEQIADAMLNNNNV
jgi:hypothetical protein